MRVRVWGSPSHEPAKIEKHMKTTRMNGETRCVICQNGYKNVQSTPRKEVFQLIGTHPRVLLVNQRQSRGKKWYRASTIFTHSLPEGPELRHLFEDENNEGVLQKTHSNGRAQGGKIGDLITADHKLLSGGCESRNNHRYAVVVQDWQLSGYSRIRAKLRRLTKPKRACESSWNRKGSLKSFTLTIP